MIARLIFGHWVAKDGTGFSRFALGSADVAVTDDGPGVRHRAFGTCHAPEAVVTVC
jgi:hypothetical protein